MKISMILIKSALNVLLSVFGLFGPELEPEIIYLRGDVRLNCCIRVIFPTLGLV